MKKGQLSYGSDIPAARQDLLALANAMLAEAVAIEAEGHRDLAQRVKQHELAIREIVQTKMTRKYNGRRASARAGLPTASQVRRVLIYLKDGDLHQQEIAIKVGINSGRVSEILNGLIYLDGDEVKRRTKGEV